jgi:hypothetical protein
MTLVTVDGIEIFYDVAGDPADSAVVLVGDEGDRGYGAEGE